MQEIHAENGHEGVASIRGHSSAIALRSQMQHRRYDVVKDYAIAVSDMTKNETIPKNPGRRSPHPERTSQILKAAEQVFLKDGFAGFSLRRVAAAAGMSLGTLQYDYPSFDLLLCATIDDLMEGYNARVLAIVNDRGTAEEKLGAIVDYLLPEMQAMRTVRLTFESLALAQRHEKARDKVSEVYDAYRDAMAVLIMEALPDLPKSEIMARATLFAAQLDGMLIYTYPERRVYPDWTIMSGVIKQSLARLLKPSIAD